MGQDDFDGLLRKMRALPRRLRLRYEHLKEKRLFYRQMRRMAARPLLEPHPGPVQSRELALATSAMNAKDIDRMSDPDIYFESAYRWMRLSIEALESVRLRLDRLTTVLEFGCGSARLLRLLRCLSDVKLIGTDMNPVCVDWCRRNIMGAEFYPNEKQPPLIFAKDASIDLIIACSVFTHIPLDLQKPWLLELHRILRPGGVFLCTVLGESYVAKMLSQKQRERLKKVGFFELGPDHEAVSLSSRHTGQDDVFQTRAQVLESFGAVFDILAYHERGLKLQDLLILQRPVSQ